MASRIESGSVRFLSVSVPEREISRFGIASAILLIVASLVFVNFCNDAADIWIGSIRFRSRSSLDIFALMSRNDARWASLDFNLSVWFALLSVSIGN